MTTRCARSLSLSLAPTTAKRRPSDAGGSRHGHSVLATGPRDARIRSPAVIRDDVAHQDRLSEQLQITAARIRSPAVRVARTPTAGLPALRPKK